MPSINNTLCDDNKILKISSFPDTLKMKRKCAQSWERGEASVDNILRFLTAFDVKQSSGASRSKLTPSDLVSQTSQPTRVDHFQGNWDDILHNF
jgi:hypothetical protein